MVSNFEFCFNSLFPYNYNVLLSHTFCSVVTFFLIEKSSISLTFSACSIMLYSAHLSLLQVIIYALRETLIFTIDS